MTVRRSEDAPVTSYLTPTEMIIFVGLGRLRFGRFVGTVGELYSYLTGRKHPKVRGEAWRMRGLDDDIGVGLTDPEGDEA